MTAEPLQPSLELLRQEYVLIQAWKKTANYIRYHNWYTDTLELDRTTVNLPEFISNISKTLETPGRWESDPLRIVPAPKRQQWRVSQKSGQWQPVIKGAAGAPLRPLAHVSVRDQVVATAVMLCLANRVETIQGDPRDDYRKPKSRKKISSYGNRLFCDRVGDKLHHRWGTAKLYRSYFQDYRAFLSRPVAVSESTPTANNQRVFIVESDLSQFYDRVRPDHLARALQSFQQDTDDSRFFEFANSLLNWGWHSRDSKEVTSYADQTKIGDFTRVALPQGLVSSGFFANAVLIPFDERLRAHIGENIVPGIRFEDACRYVDDLRIVVRTSLSVDQCETAISQWLKRMLDDEARGLLLSEDKTKAADFGNTERPFVRQTTRMERIQSEVSGGFDVNEGQAILDAIQGLMRSQQALSREPTESGWTFSPLPDVRDETVARFSAGRFRTTYRSIRPLIDAEAKEDNSEQTSSRTYARNQQDLDNDARAFALGLIQRWIEDPSNVRLLRVGLDIWPDPLVLGEILNLLKPFTEPGGKRRGPRRVAWYCLAELLRAGATETGLVEGQESLPVCVDLNQYREKLRDEAARLILLSNTTIPWYVRQQALLFLAAFDPITAPVVRTGQNADTEHYRETIRFLRGECDTLTDSEFATMAVLSRRAFLNADTAAKLVRPNLTPVRKREIAVRDPAFARELSKIDSNFSDDLPARTREDLCFEAGVTGGGFQRLTEIVLSEGPANPLRNELSILRFAAALLRKLQELKPAQFECITPGQILVRLRVDSGIADVVDLEVLASGTAPSGSLYAPPRWCELRNRWRFQLGFLLRFILSRQPDFTNFVRSESWKERSSTYRAVRNHWYQRFYGLFNGQQAFGDDWLPISDWMEQFLLALVRWPGCRIPVGFDWIESGIAKAQAEIENRVDFLKDYCGGATKVLLLPMIAEWPVEPTQNRPLRACVVQTVVPEKIAECDLTCSKPDIRRKHRVHLSAALAAVKRMLDLRKTHIQDDGHLDWLILPELAVHPRDVKTHLVPFARAYKTMILAGLTYEKLFDSQPSVNSALWIMPELSKDHGLQIKTRRQGKYHLAPGEKRFNIGSGACLQGFRPCQWLVGYPWSSGRKPLWLTASVCYDATDLRLATDLQNKSDIFAIPSFNRDVKTFDQMALALHYHMFQLVVVVNNGQYGGSSAYLPRHGELNRQIFHLHGQPQASIAFLEIKDIGEFLERGNYMDQADPSRVLVEWKHPPAGWTARS